MAIRVLVVDDNLSIRHMISSMLESRGIEVVGEATNGLEAVKEYYKLKPDIVIMDIMMPQMDGIEATRRIKQADPGAKVLAYSVMEKESLAREAISAGAVAYLRKPFHVDDVIEKIERAMVNQS